MLKCSSCSTIISPYIVIIICHILYTDPSILILVWFYHILLSISGVTYTCLSKRVFYGCTFTAQKFETIFLLFFLCRFDSDSSDYSTDDSDCSSSDLTGVDPRIAQLALGIRNSRKTEKQKPSIISKPMQSDYSSTVQQELDKKPPKANQPLTEQSKENVVASPRFSSREKVTLRDSKTSPNMRPQAEKSSILPANSLSSSRADEQKLTDISINTELTKPSKVSPPKPPRSNQGHESGAASNDNQNHDRKALKTSSGGDDETVQPYSIVDASAFHQQDKTNVPSTNNVSKKTRTSKKSSDLGCDRNEKPPLPKSSPPKSSQVNSRWSSNTQCDLQGKWVW